MLKGLLVVGSTLLAAVSATEQIPFGLGDTPFEERYEFGWPIKNVAIIGAGVSGLLSYRSLVENGNFETIRLFERDSVPGGNWHYTEEIPPSIPIANGLKDDWWKSDYVPTSLSLPSNYSKASPLHKRYDVSGSGLSEKRKKRELELARNKFRLPKPIWKTLEANTPAPQQQIPGYPWPPHVRWATHHTGLSRYLRAFASWLGVNTNDDTPDISYDTRVDKVTKRYVKGEHRGWTLVLHKFVHVEEDIYEETWWTEDFDAIVVASGRFNIPHIPAIPGLVEWQERFPEHILHSRQYRYAESYSKKNVLVVGASASATGISIDLNPFVKQSYLSVREHSDNPRAPVSRSTHLAGVPSNTTFVGEIKAFLAPKDSMTEGKIELVNGTIITGIDDIIFGTGFRYSFPYLSDYHNSSVRNDEIPDVLEQPIVTDGSHVRSLYLDTFYIDQPTIAFQGQNVGIQTFVYGKYLGTVIAKVWSGQAPLPSSRAMWRHFWNTVEERGGLRRGFQWLPKDAERSYFRHFIAWINSASIKYGGEQLDLPPDVTEEMALWQKARGIVPNKDGWNDLWSGVNAQSQDHDQWNKAAMDDW